MLSLKVFILFYIVLCYQGELSSSLKILGAFPFPWRSHFVMYGKLMKELALKGHEVDVISAFPLVKSIPNYRDIDIRTVGMEFLYNNVNYTMYKAFRSLVVNDVVKVSGIDPCDSLNHPNVQKVLNMKKGAYDVIVMEVRDLSFARLLTRKKYNIFFFILPS